jgi:hypothetical protein
MITPLESRLRESGIACTVELRERLAILVPDGAGPTREERMRAIQLARAEGITHICLELEPHGATVPRD